MKIVTGHTGTQHVTSQQQRNIYSSLFGNGDYVLPIDEEFSYQQLDSNKIRIMSGTACFMDGCIACIDAGDYEDVVIDTGIIGESRVDLICIRYYKTFDDESADVIERSELTIIKGESSPDGEFIVPDLPNDNNSYYFPIYKVYLIGPVIAEVEDSFNIYGKNKILWIGASQMEATDTIILKEKVSEQNTGIGLVFCPKYDVSGVKSTELHTEIVFKEDLDFLPGATHGFQLFNIDFKYIGAKLLHIMDDRIIGHESNTLVPDKASSSGFVWKNSGWVLRAVYGF